MTHSTDKISEEEKNFVLKGNNQTEEDGENDSLEPTAIIQIPAISDTLQLKVQSHTSGEELYKEVVERLNIQKDSSWFGLKYVNAFNELSWIKKDIEVTKMDFSKETNLRFVFCVRLFPDNPLDEITSAESLWLIYWHAQQNLVSNSEFIHYSLDGLLRLSAYALQAQFGVFCDKDHKAGYLERKQQLLPKTVLKENKISELESKLTKFHREIASVLDTTQAIKEFLTASYVLGVYGETIFKVYDHMWNKVLLGIGPNGIAVYCTNDAKKTRFELDYFYSWSKLAEIPMSFSCGKLQLNIIDENNSIEENSELLLFRGNKRQNSQIFELARDYKQTFQKLP